MGGGTTPGAVVVVELVVSPGMVVVDPRGVVVVDPGCVVVGPGSVVVELGLVVVTSSPPEPPNGACAPAAVADRIAIATTTAPANVIFRTSNPYPLCAAV